MRGRLSRPRRSAWVAIGVCLGLAGCTGGGAVPAMQPSRVRADLVLPADRISVFNRLPDAAREALAGPVSRLDPASAYLVGPRYALALDAVAVTRTLTVEDPDLLGDLLRAGPTTPTPTIPVTGGVPVHAAAGHEFVVTHLSTTTPKAADGSTGSLLGHSLSVRIGRGAPLPVAAADGGATVLISVPVGAAPFLLVDDQDGHRQSINLRTGRPGPDAVALFHPIRQQEFSDGPSALLRGADCISVLSLGPMTLALRPWLPLPRGWATRGHAWLVLTLAALATPGVVRLDPGRSVAITDPGGLFHRAVPGQRPLEIARSGTTVPSAQSLQHDIVFEVPDSFRRATMHWTLTGTCADSPAAPGQPFTASRQHQLIQQIALAR